MIVVIQVSIKSWEGGKMKAYSDNWQRNRESAIHRDNGTCVMCGKRYELVHHKDETKTNHDLGNLVSLCRSCHHKIHVSPYFKLYGVTGLQLAEILDTSWQTMSKYHKQGRIQVSYNMINNEITKTYHISKGKMACLACCATLRTELKTTKTDTHMKIEQQCIHCRTTLVSVTESLLNRKDCT